jgi:hypothetical protein
MEVRSAMSSTSPGIDAIFPPPGRREPIPNILEVQRLIRRSLASSNNAISGSSGELEEKKAKRHEDDHQHQIASELRSPGSHKSNSVRHESMDRASKPLPRNPNYTPLGLSRRSASQSGGKRVQNPRTPSDLLLRPARPLPSTAPPLAVASVPSDALGHRNDANARLPRAKSAHSAMPKSTLSSDVFSRRWTHDLADLPAQPTLYKRPSSADIGSHSINENKRPRLGKHDDGFDFGKETDKLIQEEIQRSEQAKHSSGNGNNRETAAQHDKQRKLSVQGMDSQLNILSGARRVVQSHTVSSSHNRNTGSSVLQKASLPRNSPLNNIINSASLEEDIVQARIKFRLAETQLLQEKDRYGYASRQVSARVTALNEKLACLHKRRSQIQNDAQRMSAFRRDAAKAWRSRDGGYNTITPERQSPYPPPPSPASYQRPTFGSNEWNRHLHSRYDAFVMSEPWYEDSKRVNSESGTLSAEEGPMIKHERADKQELSGTGGTEDWKLKTTPRRQVRFALTDVETFL